jgi:phosphoribosylglycinamide formyltransferase-1
MARRRTAVLISGRGSNLQALIDAARAPQFPAEIVLVISNMTHAEGLQRAADAGIATKTIAHGAFPSREAFDGQIDAALRHAEIDLVCLAGFMRVLSNDFVLRWQGRLVNIHPSLLPAFKGLKVHRQVLDAGVRISGCTVHFVVPELDSGPIIAQAAVPVLPNDSEQTLAERTVTAEHRLYPIALRLLADGVVRLQEGRAVFADGAEKSGALFNPEI